jgi:hypothetical protein
MRGPPGVYSYAPGGIAGPGYGTGNAFAGGAMSAMGGAAAFGGAAIGMASAFGRLGGIAPMIDPISGFMAGYGGMSARGIMGGLAGASFPLAAGAMAAQGVSSFVHGGHQQQMISNQLSQFQFINPQSRTGMGFTRGDAAAVGDSIRQLAHVPEMLTSVEELTRMLPRMKQMGVMNGVRDVAEFAGRFKDTIKTIRDMSKWMGTTMEDASEFFAHSRSVGFIGKQAQVQNMMNVQFTSALTGMTQGEVLGMQQGGAQISRQFGAKGRLGAEAVSNIAQKIQYGIERGTVNDELLNDVTGGVGGEKGVGIAAQRMYANLLSMSESPVSRLLLAGSLRRKEGGGFEVDKDIVGRINSRSISVDELRSRGMGLGNEAKMAFAGPEGKNLRAQLMGNVNIGAFMKTLLQGRGEGAPELVLQRYGINMSQPEIEMMMKQDDGELGVDRENLNASRAREKRLTEQTDPSAIWKRVKTKLWAGTFGRVEDMGAGVFNYIGKAYENFIDDLVGRHVLTLSKEGARAMQSVMTGTNKSELNALFSAASGLKESGTVGGGLANTEIATWLRSSGTSTGQTVVQQVATLRGQLGIGPNVPEALAGNRQASMVETMARGGYRSMEGFRARSSVGQAILALGDQYRDADPDKQSDLLQGQLAKMMSEGYGALTSGTYYNNEEDISRSIRGGNLSVFTDDVLARMSHSKDPRISNAYDLVMAAKGTMPRMGAGVSPTLAIMAGAGIGPNMRAFAGAGDLSHYMGVESRTKMVDAATESLGKAGLTSTTVGVLSQNNQMRQIVEDILAGGDKASRIMEGLNSDSDALAFSTTGLKTPAELTSLRAVLKDVMKDGGKFNDITSALGSFRKAHAAGQLHILQKAVTDQGVLLGGSDNKEAQALGATLRGFSGVRNEDEFTAWNKGLNSQLADITAHARGLKGEARAAYLKPFGVVGVGVGGAITGGERLHGRMSRKEVAEALDVSPDELDRMTPNQLHKGEYNFEGAGGQKLVTDLINTFGGDKVARSLAPAGKREGSEGQTDQKMIEALEKVSKSADLQVAVLYGIAYGDEKFAKNAATIMVNNRPQSGYGDAGAGK